MEFVGPYESKPRRILAFLVAMVMLTGLIVHASDEYEPGGHDTNDVYWASSPDYSSYYSDDNLYDSHDNDENNNDGELYEDNNDSEDKNNDESEATEPDDNSGDYKDEESDEDTDDEYKDDESDEDIEEETDEEEKEEDEDDEEALAAASTLGITITSTGELEILATDRDSLLDAINQVQASGLPGTIVVEDNFSIAGDAIAIPSGVDIALTSLTGETFTLLQTTTGQRHFVVNGTLRLYDITLSGDHQNISTAHGGVQVDPAGTLYMEEGSTIANNRNNSYWGWSIGAGGGVLVRSNGNFIMNGGKISNNVHSGNSFGGGGVFIDGGTFTMNNGEISGNESSADGGGVLVDGLWSRGSTFTMYNGKITGNKAEAHGGGISITMASSFTMHNGEISGNTADYAGGGVSVGSNGGFLMNSGKISANTADSGGGVNVNSSGIFIMEGGEISGNTATQNGGGIQIYFYIDTGGLSIDNGEASSNIAYQNDVGALLGLFLRPVGQTINGGTISNNTAMNGGGIGFNAIFDGDDKRALIQILRFMPMRIGDNVVFTGNTAQNGIHSSVTIHNMFEDYIHPGIVSLPAHNHAFTNYDIHMPVIPANAVDVTFAPGLHGTLANGRPDLVFQLEPGRVMGNTFIPTVTPNTNWTHTGWEADRPAASPIWNTVITEAITFTAVYQRTAGSEFLVTDRATLLDAISQIQALGEPATIVVQNDFPIAGDAIVIPAGLDISITSVPGQSFTLLQTATGQRHFTVEGTLRLHNITLSGDQQNINTVHGGVNVRSTGRLYMESGSTIANNRNYGMYEINGGWRTNPYSDGGGVWVGGTFIMNDGLISNNVHEDDGFNFAGGGGGGGVLVSLYSTFIMNGGEISGNKSIANGNGNGGGIFVSSGGTFTMNDGKISGNEARSCGGGVFVTCSGVFTMYDGEISDNKAESSGGGVAARHSGAFQVILRSGTFIMNGGEISGNTAVSGGGVGMGGIFIMNNGTITDNTANQGGGLSIFTRGIFTMNNGEISGNIANISGGGISVESHSAFHDPLEFIINDGKIDGNTAVFGGGISLLIVNPFDDIIINGGTISNNIATMDGGGIMFAATSAGHAGFISFLDVLEIDENVIFTGNVAQNGIRENRVLSLMFEDYIRPGTVSLPTYGHAFTNYDIHTPLTMEGSVINVTFEPGTHGTLVGGEPNVTVQVLPDTELNATHIPTVNPTTGWRHTGWEVSGTATNPIGFTVAEAVTFTAVYQEIEQITVTFAPGMHGALVDGDPNVTIRVPSDTDLGASHVPTVNANTGWRHTGWAVSGTAADPIGHTVTEAITFTAVYQRVEGSELLVTDRATLLYAINHIQVLNEPATIIVQNDFPIAGDAIIIPAGLDISITSAPGQNFTLLQTTENRRHFHVDGTLRLYNITLSGNQQNINTIHGGVQVNSMGRLYMADGSTIANNRNHGVFGEIRDGGGGVLVDFNGTFTMNGGKISNNVHYGDANIHGHRGGGGVSVYGTFIMNAGEISSNESITPGASEGGGVWVVGTFTMYNGKISYNEALEAGGGVFVTGGGIFTMHDGIINANEAGFGGGIALKNLWLGNRYNSGTFIMNGGEISSNEAISGGGVGVSGILTLNNGEISNNTANYGGGAVVSSNGSFTMNNGEISGNTAHQNGGGVNINGQALVEFIMNNGTINGNTAHQNGGGINIFFETLISGFNDVIINGGTISNNTAAINGGGVGFGPVDNAEQAEFVALLEDMAISQDVIFTGNIAQSGIRENRVLSLMFEDYINPGMVSLLNLNHAFTNYDIHTPLTMEGSIITVTFAPGSHGTLVDGEPNVTVQVLPDTELNTTHVPSVNPTVGWRHTGWAISGTVTNPIGYTVTQAITFTAVYKEIERIAVTFAPGLHGTLADEESTVTIRVLPGTELNVTHVPSVNPNTGWRHTGWAISGTVTDPIGYTVTQAVTFTAVYEEIERIAVTFAPGLHGMLVDGEPNVTVQVLPGAELNATHIPTVNPTSGWRHTGWEVNGTAANPIGHSITEAVTFTAVYEEIERITVTFTPGLHGTLVDGEPNVTVQVLPNAELDASHVPTVNANTGWRHAGWTISETATNPIGHTVTEVITFTAVYEEIERIAVTFAPGLHGTLVDGEPNVTVQVLPGAELNSTHVPAVNPNTGWRHTGWEVNGTATNPIGHTVTQAVTFTAVYEEIERITVTFTPGLHGTLVDGEPNVTVQVLPNAELDASHIPTVNANTGWRHTGWEVSGTAANPIGHNVTEAITFTAVYEEVERIIITFAPGLHGTLVDGEPNVTVQVLPGTELNATHIPTVNPSTGWRHTGWEVNGAAANPIGHNVTEAVTFTAVYEEVERITVTFAPGLHGTLVDGEPNVTIQVLPGTELNATHIPTVNANTGWRHTGWEVNGTAANPIGHTVTGPVTFTAVYEEIERITVTFAPGLHGTLVDGEPNITVQVLPNTELDVNHIPTVNANTGWIHTGWTISETATNPIGHNVTEAVTFTAVYEEVERITVTFAAGLRGTLAGGMANIAVQVLPGTVLDASHIPMVNPITGWRHTGWASSGTAANPIGHTITEAITFTAVYERIEDDGGTNVTPGPGPILPPSGSRDPGPAWIPRVGGTPGQTIPAPPLAALAHPSVQAEAAPLPIVLAQVPTEASNRFADVNNSDWFFNPVMFAYNNELMVGTSPNRFSPNAPLTRAMLVVILHREAGLPDASTSMFDDVATDTWYSDAVAWAAENGLVLGFGNGNFRPHDNITRQDLAVILARYADLVGTGLNSTRESTGFADQESVAEYASEAVARLFEAGVVNGRSGNVFDPTGYATRAEVATILYNFLD